MRETEVRISPEQNGRLAVIHVVAGQQVKRGDLLAELSNPDLAASVAEANAAALQARTNRDNVLAGVRKEEVQYPPKMCGSLKPTSCWPSNNTTAPVSSLAGTSPAGNSLMRLPAR